MVFPSITVLAGKNLSAIMTGKMGRGDRESARNMEQHDRKSSATDVYMPPEPDGAGDECRSAPGPVSVSERQAEVADLQHSLQQQSDEEKMLSGRFKERQEEEETSTSKDKNLRGQTKERHDALRRDLQAANAKYVRLLAEMENLKKRTEREKEELHKFFAESFMRDLLCVLDSFAKGFAANDAATNPKPFIAGMRMVEEQFQEVLGKHGLEVISSAGKEFDPHIHQAIQRVESEDVKTATVKEEFAQGYIIRGRLLRAAMVSVYVPSADKTE